MYFTYFLNVNIVLMYRNRKSDIGASLPLNLRPIAMSVQKYEKSGYTDV